MRPPVCVAYRGRSVLTNPPPSAGGTLLAFSLALLERGPSPPGGLDLVDAMARAQTERTPVIHLPKSHHPGAVYKYYYSPSSKVNTFIHLLSNLIPFS